VWSNYLWLHGAREENHALKASLQRLAMRQESLRQLERENARLRGLLQLNESLQLRSVGARTVARTPNFLSGALYLDKGELDGVRKDAPVLSDSGVIGRVAVASGRHSQVQLLTAPDASVGAIVERTRLPGVIKGNGGSLVELRYVGNAEDVQAGDVILTSGLDGIYPKGIRIGKVVESRKGKSVFKLIQVQPAADLLRIEEALILLAKPAAVTAHDDDLSAAGEATEVAVTHVRRPTPATTR
jgi:rod shape-determining protein MreC